MSTPEQVVEWKRTILDALPKEDIAAKLALSCLLEELIKKDAALPPMPTIERIYGAPK